MSIITNLKHYNDIVILLFKYGKDNFLKEISDDVNVSQILKERNHEEEKANDLVKDLEKLGPFYIKLGQVLCAEDFLPSEYGQALQKLQDKVKPMPYKDVEQIIKEDLGESPKQLFKEFDKDSISGASLGQVHIARLKNNKKVAVKVQRKEAQENVISQLEALENIFKYLEKTEWGRKYHVIDKFQSLKTTLINELDYKKEANNNKIIFKNLSEFKNLIVPLPIDSLTTTRVLTMDYIKGQNLSELSELKYDINAKELSEDLFRAFMKQILVDGFFQMDPHLGNVYLTIRKTKPCLALFDFGMVAHLPSHLQDQITRCLFAISEGQELEVSKLLTIMGKKLPEFDEYHLRSKVSELIGNFQELTITDIPMGKIVIKLAQIAANSGLWLPIQFNTVGKTFLSLNQVIKTLDPDFEPQKIFRNQSPTLLRQKFTKQFDTQAFYSTLLDSVDFLKQLPSNLSEIFNLLIHRDFQLRIHFSESESLSKNFEKIANRITMGVILASLVISAALVMRIETSFKLLGYPGFAIILFLLAASGCIILLISILRNK